MPLAGAGGAGFTLFHFERMDGREPWARELAANTFAHNLKALLTLYAFLKDSNRPFVSGPERSLLTRALRMAMEHKGMNAQDALTWPINRLFLADVYAVLAQDLRQEDPSTVSIIASTLREHATGEGQFYAQYNTPRQVTLQSDLAVIQFGLSGIHVAGVERALAHHFALRIAATQAIPRPGEGRSAGPGQGGTHRQAGNHPACLRPMPRHELPRRRAGSGSPMLGSGQPLTPSRLWPDS